MSDIDMSIPPHIRHGQFMQDMTPPEMSDEEARKVTPLDLLNSSNYATREIRDERLDACMGCDRLFKLTKTCKECGCFMAAKTWVKQASCPLGEWGAVE